MPDVVEMPHVTPYRLNPGISDETFERSCELVRRRMKRFNIDMLKSVLAHDNPLIPLIYNGKNIYAWYFAIGSMINPISVFLRELTPLISYPARCEDYRLVFRDHCGMADIEKCPGTEFHGVVHLLPIEEMIRLDQVEHMYERRMVKIIDYEEQSHVVWVYKMTLVGDEERPKTLPTERYLDIIVKGCEYFNVCSSYIDHLKNDQPIIPRKASKDYRTISNIPEEQYFSPEELAKHDGTDPTLPIWIAVNGKILEHKGVPSKDDPDYEHQQRFYQFMLTQFAGREVAHTIARTWYEPMYRVALNEADLSDEHRALAEDMCVCWGLNNGGEREGSYWTPIGKLLSISTVAPTDE